MDNCFGQHGWKEFHRNRKNILDEYDKAIEQSINRPVKTAHGPALEAFLRKWLSEFLPKKYGVTSGYIIQNLYEDSAKIYHFDIIIYNQLESPVLWTEGNFDDNEQGMHRAILANHVCGVLEVKSKLSVRSVSEALEKLRQIDKFKEQLNKHYVCGMIFAELKESENNNTAIIKKLFEATKIFKFFGGLVLRYESDESCTGFIRSLINEDNNVDAIDVDANKILKPLAKPIDQLNIYRSEDGNIKVAEYGAGLILVKTGNDQWAVSKSYSLSYQQNNVSIIISWSRSHFSNFCVHLLSSLEGMRRDSPNRPSFGMIFDNVETKEALPQWEEIEENRPYLKLELAEKDQKGNPLVFGIDYNEMKLRAFILVKNYGSGSAVISDDGFKSHCNILPKQIVMRPIEYEIGLVEGNSIEELKDDVKKNGLTIHYRIVFKESEKSEEFFAVTASVIFNNDGVFLK